MKRSEVDILRDRTERLMRHFTGTMPEPPEDMTWPEMYRWYEELEEGDPWTLESLAQSVPALGAIRDGLRVWLPEHDNGPGEGAVGLKDVEGVQGGERQIDSHEPG